MSNGEFNREQILEKLVEVITLQVSISNFVGKRLCDRCEKSEEDWQERRREIVKHLKNLVGKYEFATKIPRNDLGIGVMAVIRYLIKIQHTFSNVVAMIDMIRGESFGEVFLDSMEAISTKTHQELAALRNLAQQRLDDVEASIDSFNSILRLEREIDEDNIIICRQISSLSINGETDFKCYTMRKIVSELEHISDFIKEAAEIIVDI